MASTTVRARRVTEPTVVQRHPFQVDDEKPLADLATAWDNITEAKSALYRAEARIEHLDDTSGSLLEPRHPTGARLPVDSVPSMEIRSSPTCTSKVQKTRKHPYEKPRKKVTIKDLQQRRDLELFPPDLTASTIHSQRSGSQQPSNITDSAITTLRDTTVSKSMNPQRGTSAPDRPRETSSRDILGNGSANLSIGSSSEIRVLNDIRTPSLVRQASTVEVSPGLRVSKDYIPAYDRLFGDNPVMKLSQDKAASSVAYTPENKLLLQMISSSTKTKDPAMLNHMDRLRERVQQQQLAAARLRDRDPEAQRKRHHEGDPVRINSENETDFLLGLHPKVPVRKVASAPAAPAYRGFNQAEARFQITDGRIVTEDQLKRKTSRPNEKNQGQLPVSNQSRNSAKTIASKPLQPIHRQTEDNQMHKKPQKPVRKVRKTPLPTTKPKKPEPAPGVSARAWREGQKTVNKVLGPPPKVPKQTIDTVHTKDSTSEKVQNSEAPTDNVGIHTDDEVDRLSEHPIESDNDSNVHQQPEGQAPIVGHLPDEAHEVLNDLHLDDSDDGRDSSPPPAESKSSKNNNNVPRLSRKKKNNRSKSKDMSNSSAPVQKLRHYEAEEVQKYMAKQRLERRRKLQEDKKQRLLQAEKKREKLQDLYKRQRENAKTASQKGVGSFERIPVDNGIRLFDETFSKGQGSMQQHQQRIVRPATLQRNHPYQENHRKIDTTGSDKENRAFWSTSSSDSSLRSSPQTDLSSSTPQEQQPGVPGFQDHQQHQQDIGRDIVLEPVKEEESLPVIRNQLNENAKRGEQPADKAAAVTAPRPNPAPSPGKPRSKAERIAALKATAAALQGRLEDEVRQLTGDLSNLAANALAPGQSNQASRSPSSRPVDRWAYPIPGVAALPNSSLSPPARPGVPPVPTISNQSQSATKATGVRFSEPEPTSPLDKLTRHQKVAGTNQDFNVFKGELPGVRSLFDQAQESQEKKAKSSAATTIQAAYRGHQVRQKLHWELPSGSTLKDRIQGRKEDVPIPQIRLSTGLSLPNNVLQSDGESLSEGPLSAESSEAEVDQEYTPKFKSLPTRARPQHLLDSKQTNINFGPSPQGPERDGLSVIDIYMKRYQEAQRDLMTRQSGRPVKQDKSPSLPQSYSEDFTGGSQASSSHIHSIPLDSPEYSKTGRSPIPSSSSADNISQLTTPRSKPSTKDTVTSRPPTGRSISLPSPRDTSHSFADSSHSLNVSDKKRSRTPSPRPTTLRDAGTQTPPSSRSSPSSIKSRSSSSRGSHSPPSDARSPVSDHKSPVDEIRSLIEDLKKSTSNGESVHSEGVRSGMSPGSRTSQGHSPSVRTPVDSPTTPQPSQGSLHRNAKSPVRREVLSHFKPISQPASEMSARSSDLSRSTTSTLTSTILQPGPKFYSPSALQLKMAAELNLLETLEESVRQLSEVERTRAVSLAHEESASLAKILQNRQRDHEKELQMLSLKAKQEVEEANRQLEEVKQKAVETALEAEQVLVKARKDAASETRDSAQKLLMTQADAARITAEAAKQLAEAHKVSVSKPSPPLPVDPGQVAADSAKAAATAAVTAALEQQRLHQKDMLHEMRASVHPPPPVTRSVAAGNSRPSSMTPSRSMDTRTPSAHYSEDFTNTSSSHTPSSAYTASSSHRVLTAQDSSFSRQSDASKSIKTASDLSLGLPDQTDSIATASDIVSGRDASISAASVASSSIRTESGARAASSITNDSISEDIDKTKSNQYSLSFEDSDSSSRSSVLSVVSPSPDKSETKRDSRPVSKHAVKDRPDSSDSMQSDKEGSFSGVTIEVLQKQLKEEESRSQQQVTLLKLREKVLVDKTNAELEWLEHQKRRLKEKDDQDGVTSLRKRQRALLSKLQIEQNEIKQMLTSQRQASLERQRLLHQQQEIARMRRATARYKDQMKDLPPASPNVSSILPTPSEGDDASIGGSMSGSMSDSMLLSPPGGEAAAARDSTMDASATEKQARVLQKLKMLQQPLSMKLLMKREMKLKKRRKNAEELLAWKQRLDEEEKHVAHMEHEVLHLWDGGKRKMKPTADTPSSAPASPARDKTKSDRDEESEDYSMPSSSSKTDVSTTRSHSQHPSVKTTPSPDPRLGSSSDASIMEDIQSKTSSIAEEIGSEKSQSAKSISESPHTGTELSSDDTIKEASGLHEYTSDSFESTADRTLTPSKHSTHQGQVPPAGVSTPPGKGPTALSSSTPKSVSSTSTVASSSRRGPFIPRNRNRHPSDSGSESEKSFSQTMSETASDQSDIEGRVRALKDALKRRKMEADRLRKQQKRLNREKLKAQEASLKKQLETYDRFVETTKAELEQESKKQKLPASSHLLPMPSAKPQIKQPKAGTDSLRHARALRQRTASDSSQEGALSEARSVVSIKGGPSMSESGRSSRSSLEGGVTGEERVPSVLGGSLSYSSFSATSSPSTHHSEGGVSPKSPYSLSRDHSASASSSIAEDISIRSDYSDRESAQDSEKFDSEDHRKIKEKLQQQHHEEEVKDIERTSSVGMINGRRSGDGRDAEEDIPKTTPGISPPLAYRPTPSPGAEVDDDVSVSSSVPEEIISAASIQTQDSFEESKSAVIISNLPESDHELSFGDSFVESPRHAHSSPPASQSPESRKATVTPVPEDASQRSQQSIPSSIHVRSSHSSVKSEASYSADFIESSPTSKRPSSKSDTDEDISEHLSEVSEVSLAKSSLSQSSGHLVFDLKDKSPVHEDPSLDLNLNQPEVTIIPQKPEEEEEEVFDDKPACDIFADATLEPEIKEVLPGFQIGDRVLIGGKEPGTLRFKGTTQFATGNWIGIELDEPEGTNNGTLNGVTYFTCKPNYGIFAPEDKIVHLPKDYKPSQDSQDEEASEPSSIEEDLPSQSSVRTVSESELVRTISVSHDKALEHRSREGQVEEEDKESDRSLSQLTSIQSEDILEAATEDELSEGGIDDDALEKLISHAAEAVESFSLDEPGLLKVDPALETPRGAPEDEYPDIEELPHEDEQKVKQNEAENHIVDSITDHLTEIIVKDTFDAVLEIAGKQQQDEQEEKSKDSLLKLLVSAESPRSDSEFSEVPIEKAEEDIPEKEPKQSAERQAESVVKSLLNEAIGQALKLRKQKNAKIELANERVKKEELDVLASQDIKTPEDSLSPELRAETPYTPDKSPERKFDNISPLDDDIFINRVHVESSSGSDNLPVARPGSPIFGESGSVSPDALNEKLEQLQLLDKDILEADLFGDQEWFDDEFGSMKKSQSIIKVPERIVSPKKAETPAGVAAQEAKVAAKQRNAKLDLKKIVEEPFYAVPHNINDVKDLASQSVTVFHEKVQNDESVINVVPPSAIMGSDTKGSDIESTSRKAYKNLIFTLSGEVYQAICQEQEPTVQPPWMKPKRKPRRYFFQQPPSNESDMATAVEGRVLALSGLITKQKPVGAVGGSKLGKKKDHVDEILIDELKEEEPEWIDYDNDELSVKMQLADALFESLLVDTAIALHQIEDKRKARAERRQEDTFSHHDVEF
ncbi:centrosome-associated protein 350-like isoform X3 [Lytechinus variegatus]|uniref:centrosome-associated protein 350-like isoform X3 n=1 Tax=Lytechinus variegatus TaxID=7654 RepID=UPI001BB27C74|nr:centrosome-associated protein 350-like isoform X3 [Lytechinus variegatus]